MKSLEIVNEQLEMLKHPIIYVEERENIKKLELIKQDLEVLEILRNYLEVYIWQNLFSEEHELEVSIVLKHIEDEKERIVVKQWLEENENDR